jgi:DNA polymerase-3 subunit gamma/tau
MSYQVLARKYRPQRFDDVVGQEVVTRTLRNAIASGRIAHAFRLCRLARVWQDDDGADPGACAELHQRTDAGPLR